MRSTINTFGTSSERWLPPKKTPLRQSQPRGAFHFLGVLCVLLGSHDVDIALKVRAIFNGDARGGQIAGESARLL